jgi:hypothetical protein
MWLIMAFWFWQRLCRRVRFFGSGTNAEKIAAAANGGILSSSGKQNGNPV